MPDGSLDAAFDGDGKVIVSSPTAGIADLALQRDGKIVTAGGSNDFGIARFNVDGSVDRTFGGDGSASAPFPPPGSWTTAIAVQRDGQIVAAGVTGYPGIDFAVARFDPAGRLDLGFGSEGLRPPSSWARAASTEFLRVSIRSPAASGPRDRGPLLVALLAA